MFINLEQVQVARTDTKELTLLPRDLDKFWKHFCIPIWPQLSHRNLNPPFLVSRRCRRHEVQDFSKVADMGFWAETVSFKRKALEKIRDHFYKSNFTPGGHLDPKNP